MDKIAEFVRKNRAVCETPKKVEIKEVKVPWYRRPLEHNEFITRKAKDGKYYIHHGEWSKRVWIGPYKNEVETNIIIDSYVTESLKSTLVQKAANQMIHSIIVEDEKEFF